MSRTHHALPALFTLLLGCAIESPPTVEDEPQHLGADWIDVRRSLVVTEQPILDRFPFERVLDQLVDQSGVSTLTSRKLFKQWWDTQNPKPGLGQGAHCDDVVSPTLGSTINSFPYTCRPSPSEGAQATCDPFAANSPCAYVPIGLFNRFDLTPENGAHCGEYRIVYAKATGVLDSSDRNLIIFEAVMPNPLPLLGLAGCRGIAQFWADLSEEDDLEARADRLEAFYFDGLELLDLNLLLPPVVHVAHLGDNPQGRGQIRTNQFVLAEPRIWSLREFKLKSTCNLLGCSAMRVVPVTNKTNPYGPLFSATSTHPRTVQFQAWLPAHVEDLASDEIPDLGISVPDTFNSGQSQATSLTPETNYPLQFGEAASPLRGALDAELASMGSSLTSDDLVRRASAMSCAGCHRFSNNVDLGGGLVWPPSLGFTHVTERETEVAGGVTRYRISDALANVFLPHRKEVLADYLDGTLILRLIPLRPIGGLYVH
jgi:hypothetical protein